MKKSIQNATICEECFEETTHLDGKCPGNARRSRIALDTLEYFAKHGGEWILGEDKLPVEMIEQNMADLLCNFAHLCDEHGVWMGNVLRKAESHYNVETCEMGEQDFSPYPSHYPDFSS